MPEAIQPYTRQNMPDFSKCDGTLIGHREIAPEGAPSGITRCYCSDCGNVLAIYQTNRPYSQRSEYFPPRTPDMDIIRYFYTPITTK